MTGNAPTLALGLAVQEAKGVGLGSSARAIPHCSGVGAARNRAVYRPPWKGVVIVTAALSLSALLALLLQARAQVIDIERSAKLKQPASRSERQIIYGAGCDLAESRPCLTKGMRTSRTNSGSVHTALEQDLECAGMVTPARPDRQLPCADRLCHPALASFIYSGRPPQEAAQSNSAIERDAVSILAATVHGPTTGPARL
ncbi:hypothetical protein EAS61_11655 [Bradyrhizobium zhanjiangense]|uniref:Uncharacterized protein n=1 Tax=Bradyrhizobium zhanjiangense TaxID=1325107 RepID=A0A4Q0QQN1_9BRAD|nr:hypothetical protein EAS61_11655 [Bradyrhizobium zhanjiangense]